MKQFFLIAACILFANYASYAQASTINFDNQTPNTVYVSGQWGPASTPCTPTLNYNYAVPPGLWSISVAGYGGTVGVDEFFHIRVYSYNPSAWMTCSPAPINDINISPCLGFPSPGTIDIYDTCPSPTLYPATVTWTPFPTYIDVLIQ